MVVAEATIAKGVPAVIVVPLIVKTLALKDWPLGMFATMNLLALTLAMATPFAHPKMPMVVALTGAVMVVPETVNAMA